MPAKVPVSIKLVLRRGDAMLVLRDRASGLGDLPGGRMEPGEVGGDWLAALRREVREELGAVDVGAEPSPRFAFPHRIHATGEEAVGLLWVGDLRAGEPVLSDEHDAAWWRPLRDGADPSLPPSLHEAVARWLLRP